MKQKLRILHLEDNKHDAELIHEKLAAEGVECDVTLVDTREGFISALEQGGFDIVLADYKLPSFDGISALKLANEKCPEVPFIIISGTLGEDVAVETLKSGAADYVLKEKLFRLSPAVRRALQEAEEKNEHKRAEEALRENEEKYRTLVENIPQKIFTKDRHSVYLSCNENYAHDLGITPEEIAGKTDYDFFPRELADNYRSDDIRIMESGETEGIEEQYVQNGEKKWIYTVKTPMRNKEANTIGILGIFSDITERKQKEEELRKLTRILRARNKSSHAMAEAKDELWYLNEVCRTIVEDCGHAMVWIGFADDDENKTVRPVAHAGFEEGYVESMNITWADRDRGRGPVGTAIRTGKPVIIQDTANDDRFAPWRAEALRRGYASVIAVPLLSGGKAFGSLNIYSGHPNSFTEEEAVLLIDLAADLSYGITTIRTRSAQAEAENKFRDLAEQSVVGIYLIQDGIFKYVNPMLAETFGYTDRELIDKEGPEYLVLSQDWPTVRENLRKRISGGIESIHYSFRGIKKNKEIIHVEVYGSKTVYKARPAVVGTLLDITDRTRSEEKLVELYQQVKEEAEVSGSLLQMVEALNTSLDEKELIKTVLKLAPRYLKFDRIGIFLYDESVRGFTFSGGYGFSLVEEGILLSRNFKGGDFPAMDKAIAGETVIVENALESDLISKELVDIFGMMGSVIVPIIAREKVIGGIYADFKSLRPIEKREVSFLKGLADGIAIALQNSRLYRESVERLMELSGKIETIKAMATLDREILSTIDRGTILQTAVALVNRIIPCERAAVLFREGENYRVISEWGVGKFLDNIYSVKNSHFEVLGTKRGSLFIPDLAGDTTECQYHREQNAIGIRSSLLVPLVTKGETIGLLDIGSTFHGRSAPAHLSTAENIGSQITVALENARLYEELQQLLISTITSLASAIDAKSPWTKGHSERVTQYALQIGGEMGLKEEELERLKLSGLLHDVGKIGTYDTLLDKPGKLTDEEFELVKKHPGKGAEILAPIKQLSDVIPGVRYHHERYDGKGYPDGLKGENIPVFARIICLADSFDSMTADRPYRPSPGKEYAISEFRRCTGTQFDPHVVDAFLKVLSKSENP